MKSGFDIKKTPLAVTWETTQACDPPNGVQHAAGERHPLELNADQAEKLIADVAELCPPIFTFAGSDPLRRPDIFQLIASAAFQGLHPVLTVSATSSLTADAVLKMKRAGLSRLALNVDGPTEEIHDQLLGPGSFGRTMAAMYWANRCLLPVQVHTTVSRRNMNDLENILHLIKSFNLTLWNLVFPTPANPSEEAALLSPVECEGVFARIYKMSQQVQFKIKTTEAQHYRRYVLQQRTRAQASGSISEGIPGILPINEARGSIFISHTGEVFPGARLPLSAGNIRDAKLAEIYRDSELFRKFRDTDNLDGKCGACECREICGGSRARVFALTGELFGEDPCCIYQPKRVKPAKAKAMPVDDVEAGAEASSQ